MRMKQRYRKLRMAFGVPGFVSPGTVRRDVEWKAAATYLQLHWWGRVPWPAY